MRVTSDDSRKPARLITRRRLIGTGIAIMVSAIVPLWVRRRSVRRASPALPDPSSADFARMVDTVAALSGALFGHLLSSSDVAEVSRNLRAIAAIDPPLAALYPMVAEFAELAARRVGASSFLTTTLPERNAIVDHLMAIPVDTRRSRLLAQLSRYERYRQRVRWEVMDKLPRIYARSGPAWRRRGYARWPGIGGDPREYTRPAPAMQC